MRKIDQRITQTEDPQALLWRLNLTLNAAWVEAREAFHRQLENYEILSHRIKQIQESLPKQAREVTVRDGLETKRSNTRNAKPHEPGRPKKIRGPARNPPRLPG